MAKLPRSTRRAGLRLSFSRHSKAQELHRWSIPSSIFFSRDDKDPRKKPLGARRKLIVNLLKKSPKNIRLSR